MTKRDQGNAKAFRIVEALAKQGWCFQRISRIQRGLTLDNWIVTVSRPMSQVAKYGEPGWLPYTGQGAAKTLLEAAKLCRAEIKAETEKSRGVKKRA